MTHFIDLTPQPSQTAHRGRMLAFKFIGAVIALVVVTIALEALLTLRGW